MNKVALQYLSNVYIQFNTASYLKLNFKPKIDPKCVILISGDFKNLKKIC